MCGEQLSVRFAISSARGSPPRVRGTVLPQLQKPPGLGITPACAGNSFYKRRQKRFNEDHPRVCGEQRMGRVHSIKCAGSPPRVRGTVLKEAAGITRFGITPACAGNSPLSVARAAFAKDHPRVCGEQPPWAVGRECAPGSPPRVRGTALFLFRTYHKNRITPACAGNRPAGRVRRTE